MKRRWFLTWVLALACAVGTTRWAAGGPEGERKGWKIDVDIETAKAAFNASKAIVKWFNESVVQQHQTVQAVYEVAGTNVVVVPIRRSGKTRITDNINFDPCERWSDYWVAHQQHDPDVRIYVANLPEGIMVSDLAMQQKHDEQAESDGDRGPQIAPGQPHPINRGHNKYYAKRNDLWDKLDGKGCYLVIAGADLTAAQLNTLPGVKVQEVSPTTRPATAPK
jgi:hypothetical protein